MVFARVCAVVGLVGVVVVAVGSFGAWATISSASVSGVDGGRDGWITLAFAVLTAIFLAGVFTPVSLARVLRWFPLPLSVLILLVALINIVDIASTNDQFTDQFSDDTFTLSVGWGLWLVLAGSVAIAVPGLLMMFASMPLPARQAPPVPGPYVPGGMAPPGWPPHPQGYVPQPPYPGRYPPQAPQPPQPPSGQYSPPPQPPQPPAPPAWPSTGPAYPGSIESDDRSPG